MIGLSGKLVLNGMSDSFHQSVSNTNLSKLVIGTMRLADKFLTISQTRNLFKTAIDRNIDSFHISHEYSSYDLVCKAFKLLNNVDRDEVKIIAKLPEPHFDKCLFSKVKIEENIDSILASTSLDRIDVAQWMWRLNPLNDELRINRTNDQLFEIKDTFERLIISGKVRNIICFPYSSAYMKFIREFDLCNFHVNYLNFWEDPLIDGGIGENSIALRPLGSGKAFQLSPDDVLKINEVTKTEASCALEHCIRFPLSHKNISSIVVGINSVSQLDQIADIVDCTEHNMSLFESYRDLIGVFD